MRDEFRLVHVLIQLMIKKNYFYNKNNRLRTDSLTSVELKIKRFSFFLFNDVCFFFHSSSGHILHYCCWFKHKQRIFLFLNNMYVYAILYKILYTTTEE